MVVVAARMLVAGSIFLNPHHQQATFLLLLYLIDFVEDFELPKEVDYDELNPIQRSLLVPQLQQVYQGAFYEVMLTHVNLRASY